MNTNEISPQRKSRLKRIQVVSGIFRTVFFTITLLCIVAGVVSLPLLLLHNSSGVTYFRAGWIAGTMSQWTFAIFAWCCYKLFALYSEGDLFTARIVSSIRRVAYAYVLMVVAASISQRITIHSFKFVSQPINADPGWGFSISTLVGSIFPAFLIIFIAWVMDEARKIREEQELTV